MPQQIAIVKYLVLGESPHLCAAECIACGARYFDRRNACASCGSTTFVAKPIPAVGELYSFTIVYQAAPGITTPFVAGVVNCGGTAVRGNVINIAPDSDHVRLGMRVRLATYSLGARNGVEAIGYGFEPVAAGD
jgi:uncharacterized OB-fold protein